MPKLIVLFYGGENAAALLAESAADGAKGIRFTEVDIRAAGPADGKYKPLESAAQLIEYDGVLLIAGGARGEMPAALLTVLAELELGDAFSNTVFGVAGGDGAAVSAVVRLGGIIVSEPRGADDQDRARKLGARMGKVTGWVRHALGHEAEHHHHH